MLCFSLDLPDPLPRDLELVAEHCQGGGAPIVETVAAYQHVPMTLGELLDSFLKEGQLHLAYDLASRIGDALIFDEFFHLRAILFRPQGYVEAGDVRHGISDVTHLIYGPPQPFCHLLVCRLAPERGRELVVGAHGFPYLLARVHGDADGAALVCHAPANGLPYPPRSIGREAEALLGVEPRYSLHQPYVSLLDQILEGKTHPPVFLGHRDHQPEVALYQLFAGSLVSGTCSPGEV